MIEIRRMIVESIKVAEIFFRSTEENTHDPSKFDFSHRVVKRNAPPTKTNMVIPIKNVLRFMGIDKEGSTSKIQEPRVPARILNETISNDPLPLLIFSGSKKKKGKIIVDKITKMESHL